MFAAGLALMAHATSAPLLDASAGALIGFGLAGTSFTIVLATFGKLLPPEWRSLAFGLGTAAGSFGQFLYSPLSVVLIDAVGWQQTLVIFAVSMLAVLPLSLALATPPAADMKQVPPQSLGQALSEAFAHPSYVLLVLGFFTCGFQLAFITVHLPAYLVDRGLSAQVGGWTLATIGLFNIFGSVTYGWLSDRMPKRYLLSFNYFMRAAAIFAFISFPVTPVTAVLFGAVMGLVWLSVVPPTNGIITVMFGTRWFATLAGFAFLQPPDRRLPRRLARRPRVRAHGVLRSGVVAVDPARHHVGADQHADRRETGGADRRPGPRRRERRHAIVL